MLEPQTYHHANVIYKYLPFPFEGVCLFYNTTERIFRHHKWGGGGGGVPIFKFQNSVGRITRLMSVKS